MSFLRRPAASLAVLPLAVLTVLTACASKPAGQTAEGAPAPATAAAATAAPESPAAETATLIASADSAAASAAPAAPASDDAPAAPASGFAAAFLSGDVQKTASGVEYVDTKVGTGPALAAGSIGVLEFTGWLGDGKEFDSSKERPGEFCFLLGSPRSIAFFNEGLAGMKAGGTRRVRVAPAQGYGAAGRPPIIPPNSTLLFEVKMLDLRQSTTKPDTSKLKFKETPSGLRWADLAAGAGDPVVEGSTASVHYSGFLEDGTKFDSSVDRCQPFDVKNIGRAPVIPGWNEGLVGMKAGGRRVLVIPPGLAYGSEGRPPVIPQNATLTFEIEVLSISPPPKAPEPMTFPEIATLKLTSNPSGLRWADVRPGKGAEIKKGSTAALHYTGWLESGKEFDSSVPRGETFDLRDIGNSPVIPGWNEGLVGIKEGGRRVLVIPPDLAYGASGYPPVIPPNSTLVFMIEAVKVTP